MNDIIDRTAMDLGSFTSTIILVHSFTDPNSQSVIFLAGKVDLGFNVLNLLSENFCHSN